MDEDDYLRVRRRPTGLSRSGSGSGSGVNPYRILVEKFRCHVRDPDTTDTDTDINGDDCPFTGTTSKLLAPIDGGAACSPDILVEDDNYSPMRMMTVADGKATSRSDDHDGPFTGTTSRCSSAIEGDASCSPDFDVPSNLETILLQAASPRPYSIPLQYLKKITDNFSDKRILGHGGFGVVYKGERRNGEMIAVKKIISSLKPGLQDQFESEVCILTMLQHPNIVRCVGHCYKVQKKCLPHDGKYVFAEMAEMLLCLEYMSKGSLDKLISDESSGLDWSTRYNIIEGVCYGLYHLHEEIDKPIIHLDLKPANILLNDCMTPKIADFGLSRLLDQQQTICTKSRDGTLGYMAQEFILGGKITPKSDIFSLGVIILEVVTGHRDYPDVTTTPSDDFIQLTLEKWRNVLQRTPVYVSVETDCEQIKRCIQVGIMCVNPDRTKRPPIKKVISMLQGSDSNYCVISNKAI